MDRLRKDPPVFDMFPVADDEIVTRRTWVGSYTTKGVITLSDLRHRFMTEYGQQVTDRPEWHKLKEAFKETLSAYYDATQAHRERSKINAENRGWFGIDIVRNIIEAVGEGDEDYPSIRQWDEPKRFIDQAGPALRAQQFELAVPLLAMAEMSTAQAAQKIFAYDHRVETGAATAVKWLNRVKTAGSIAASIAAGPLGITGSALVAGGYTFVQEGAQNASALAHGQRTDLGLAGLVKQAGTATVLGLLGGALQTRFQAAMAARLAAVTGKAGGALREAAVSSAAAMTSSVYNTAAEAVLNAVVNGQALPKDAQRARRPHRGQGARGGRDGRRAARPVRAGRARVPGVAGRQDGPGGARQGRRGRRRRQAGRSGGEEGRDRDPGPARHARGRRAAAAPGGRRLGPPARRARRRHGPRARA